MNEHEVWERIHTPNPNQIDSTLDRIKVPGGWLYRHRCDVGVTMTFVPDPVLYSVRIDLNHSVA